MTIVCRTSAQLVEVLRRRGFFLVTDLPRPLRLETRRGMLIARVS